ncbi:RNA cap guanine-N2 methyltransferase-domain-containing protein [Leptodontidium sp. 2 PMI_412]|nr:RNA cap guanine-N2 methyltransferase-domain-containing protein [Leptodontidium sp. MPI-SDFR-AT-0119]KAH9218921.1 RNA cap guanine-N2 methyltransferase-domain-containing protein [Leptodontidium sp. 2 PMI_412]
MPSTMAVQEPSSDQGSQIFELTDKCHHYTKIGQVEYDIQKYWQQRFSIWSLYNEGIYMTDDAWFGVTPEPVANKVAEDFAALIPETKTILIDMFAGAGGNVIAFALTSRWMQIIAIEKDVSVIACAQHNATIYGVADQITWINDDSFAYLAKNSSSIDPAQTVVFASPPWGGPRYMEGDIFNLSKMQPYSIDQIYEVVKTMDSALYLPRGSDLRQIARLAPGEKKIEVVQYCVYGASKAMVAYIPAISPSWNTDNGT